MRVRINRNFEHGTDYRSKQTDLIGTSQGSRSCVSDERERSLRTYDGNAEMASVFINNAHSS